MERRAAIDTFDNEQANYRRPVATAELSRRALLREFAPASIVINKRGIIQYLHGAVQNYLEFPSGEPELNVTVLAKDGLKARVRYALKQLESISEPFTVLAPAMRRDANFVSVHVQVRPLPSAKGSEPLYLVSFLDDAQSSLPPPVMTPPQADNGEAIADCIAAQTGTDRLLTLELQITREDLRSTIEELESANEELNASNEEASSMDQELQSAVEELETSKEELQSLNEELSTVNNQLHENVQDLEDATDDLTNLLSSTEMATIFLDRELRIRMFTPATNRLMHILDTDVGRPVDDLFPRIRDSSLVDDSRSVLESLTSLERVVADHDAWYLRRISPFRTSQNRIEGVVVVYTDITLMKKASDRLFLRERQQAAVAELGRQAFIGTDLPHLLQEATQAIKDILNVEMVKVLKLTTDMSELELVAGVGWSVGLVGSVTVANQIDSQAGYTLQSSKPVIVTDLAQERRFSGPSLLTDHNVVSGMSVVMGPAVSPWGILGVHSNKPVAFTADDTNFISIISNLLWEAVQRHEGDLTRRRQLAEIDSVFQNSPAGLSFIDTDLRFVRVNLAQAEINGVPPEEHLGRTIRDVLPDLADAIEPLYRKVLATHEPLIDVEVEGVTSAAPQEHKYWLTTYAPTIIDGECLGVITAVTEITALKEAEFALAESEERLKLAARAAGFGTYYSDIESGEMFWSPEYRDILGVSEEMILAKRLADVPGFVHAEDRERVELKLQASLDPTGDGRFEDEHRILKPDGEVRWLMVQGRTVFRGRGEKRRPSRLAGVAIDITEQHAHHEKLEEARRVAEAANEAKSTFLANMSHEIRTPMTAILGYADVLDVRLDDAESKACIKTIKQNGVYLCSLLDDILDLSKIEAGKASAHPEPCSLLDILADVRSLMTLRATQASLLLSLEFDGEIPEQINTDTKLVRQILVNLVGNAIKFTDRGGVSIVTRCLARRDLMQIQVIDTGVGIYPADVERLFRPFEQLDNSFTRSSGGSGLGLSISRHLVHLLGGEIDVQSEPGAGSTFTFTFNTGPLGEAQWIAPDSAYLGDTSAGSAGKRPLPTLTGYLLVADDRYEIRLIVREFLEAAGARLDLVENGQQMLQCVDALRESGIAPDAILMDLQMPVMDGLRAASELRADGYNGPLIALTANVMERDRELALQAGFSHFIDKPIDRENLISVLHGCLTTQSSGPSCEEIPLLCVDDNASVARAQQRLLETRGFQVEIAHNTGEALRSVENFTPSVALIDLQLGEESGAELLRQLKSRPTLAETVYICFTGRGESEVDWKDLGFDGFCQKPITLDALEQLLRDCLA